MISHKLLGCWTRRIGMPSKISSKCAVSLMAVGVAAIMSSCGGANPALKDPLGANHYFISQLPSAFKDSLPKERKCEDCTYFESIEERTNSKWLFTIEFGYRCATHDLCLETYFSDDADEMAKMRLTITAMEIDMPFLEGTYRAYSSIVRESSKSLSDIINEKNADACYGDETESYQVWYGTFGKHEARFSKFADGSCKISANGDVKSYLLGAMM